MRLSQILVCHSRDMYRLWEMGEENTLLRGIYQFIPLKLIMSACIHPGVYWFTWEHPIEMNEPTSHLCNPPRLQRIVQNPFPLRSPPKWSMESGAWHHSLQMVDVLLTAHWLPPPFLFIAASAIVGSWKGQTEGRAVTLLSVRAFQENLVLSPKCSPFTPCLCKAEVVKYRPDVASSCSLSLP